MARGAFAACLLLFLQAPVPSVRFDSGRNLVLLEGWPAAQLSAERYPDVLIVSVDAADVPAVLGSYYLEGGSLTFAPRYPLQAGVRYRVVARVPNAAPITMIVNIPKPEVKATTVVEHVYPSSDVLPENQLKFYIHFSAAMARGSAYDHISLVDESGIAVKVPFLELVEELWDPAVRRFTLFFDPGRIKRGLVSQQELGIALQEGKHYTLVIDKGWKDAVGNPLAAEYRKTFLVGQPDRQPIDIKAWTVRAPAAGSREAVTLVFPEAMDHAILQRDIEVLEGTGAATKPVSGAISVGPDEKSWMFTPDAAWKRGSYTIQLGSAIADLAGNMIGRPFEIDVFDKVDPDLLNAKHTIPFIVK